MRNRPVEPLGLELIAACGPGSELHEHLAALMPRLAEARQELLPVSPRPSLLEEYRSAGGRGNRCSRLGHILATARRLADEVDRVVLVAGRDVCLAARAVLDSCAHPYHNELSRAERGGYPRIYLAPETVDNDALQALLDLLAPPRSSGDIETRWALVMADEGTLENAVVSRALVEALKRSLGGDCQRVAKALVSVPGSRVSAADGLLNAGVLLPAALAGLDIVGLLSGAAAMSDRFADDPAETNDVLRLAGLCHLTGQSVEACQIVVWAKALESAAAWYRRLRTDLHASPSPGKIGRTPLVLHVATQRVRRDRLIVDELIHEGGQPAVMTGNRLPEIAQGMLAAAAAANRADDQPAVQVRLPQIDERSVGQLLQMLELAIVVEARLANLPEPAGRCRQRAETGQRDTDSTHDTP